MSNQIKMISVVIDNTPILASLPNKKECSRMEQIHQYIEYKKAVKALNNPDNLSTTEINHAKFTLYIVGECPVLSGEYLKIANNVLNYDYRDIVKFD